MAWSTIRRGSTISLILQLLIIQSISSSSQDKYNNHNRPHSEIYSKNRVNENSSEFRPSNLTSEQNINTRHFTSTPHNYSPNFVQGYNPQYHQYQHQQPVNFGYPGGTGINNFQGTNGFGYPGSGYGGTGIGFPSGNYPGGNPGLIDEKGLLFPLPVPHYPQLNFQQSSTFKPPYQQSTSPFNVPQGFGGFYPNYPGLPTTPHNYNHHHPHQGHSHYYPGNKSPHDGFDIGSLPRQVRVPGVIEVNLNGRNAEITCEFPRYLLLVQGIYWHHKYDAFGSYFDTQNKFGPRITVQPFDQWKSVLRIEEYVEDDFGIYRCISAAALPTDDKPIQFPAGGFSTRTGQINQQPSTTPIYQDNSQEFDSGETQSREERVKKRKNSRKMKFPPTRKIRFTRQAEKDNSLDQDQDDQYLSATIPSNYFPTTNNEPYDPFFNTRPYETPAHLRNGYLDYNSQQNPYNTNNNNFRYPTTPNQNPFIPNPNLQTNRHLYPGFGHGHGHYPGGFETTSFPNSQTPGYGLQVPYYKPSYSIYTVFQEVTFQPVPGGGVRSASTALSSTSPNPKQMKN